VIVVFGLTLVVAMKKKCCDQGLVVATQDNEDANNSGRNLTETINSLSTVVTDMKKVIEDLIRENKKLRQEIESMKSDKQQAKSADLDMNDMGVDEAMDRIRRANNVIIRGIPEAGGNIKLRYKLSRTLYHQLYLITIRNTLLLHGKCNNMLFHWNIRENPSCECGAKKRKHPTHCGRMSPY
jgi:regulator of replication initiation timing